MSIDTETSAGALADHLRDCLRYIDEKTLERFGQPLYCGLLQFPGDEHELVSFASNAEPAERDKFAQAMIAKLVEWGYVER